jgi:hypothetical protein
MSQPPPFRKVLDHRIEKIAENMHVRDWLGLREMRRPVC